MVGVRASEMTRRSHGVYLGNILCNYRCLAPPTRFCSMAKPTCRCGGFDGFIAVLGNSKVVDSLYSSTISCVVLFSSGRRVRGDTKVACSRAGGTLIAATSPGKVGKITSCMCTRITSPVSNSYIVPRDNIGIVTGISPPHGL